MKKLLLRALAITACVAFSFAGAQAQVITAERAQEIANNFFQNGKQKSAAVRSTTATSLKKSADSRILSNGSSNEAPTFHILTPASGEGFVIVSGEEIENPIIGYSFEGTIDTNDLPVGFVDYITDIDAQVKALRKYNAENPQKAAAARSAMQKTNYNATTMGNKVYLETASWGQDYPFNTQCFTSYNGSTNALTGCVPTAYAIIMRYHEWPQVGTGTLYNCQAPTYVEITDRTYDYSKMPLVYDGNWSTEQINEVAKLMSHLGHSFMVTYGSSQTSVSDPSNTEKPNKYFNYNLVYASYQANFTMDSWEEKIKESIDNGCPIPYASDNAGTGDTRHMFVLDGYTQNDYFHFNFGWYGNGNGWFKLDAITPSQGDNYSWQDGADHYAIFNFTPNKTKYAVNASVSPENAGTVSVNGSAAASSATGEYLQGATVTLAATANTGYTFSNWTKGGEVVSTNKSCQIKVDSSDNDYVANFLTVGNTTVNVSVTYNGSYGTVTGTSGTVANGTTLTPRLNEEVTLTATPADGYIFTGWTVTKGTESTNYSGTSLTFVATGEMSVTANFTLAETDYIIDNTTGTTLTTDRVNYWEHNAIKLTLSTDDGGIAYNGYISLFAGASGSETYTLTAPTGYTITKYKFSQCRSQSTSSTYNLSIVADAEYPLTTSEQDITISNVNAATAQFTVKGDAGRSMYTKQIIVTLKKDGAGSGESTPTTYTINVTAGEGGTATVNGNSSATVTEGATVTLTATPNSGYEFVNWTKGGIEVSTNATYSFTANASAEYIANFRTAASNEKTLNVTYSGATWNNEESSWWVSVVTNTTPAVTVKTTDGTPKIGYSTFNGVRHPYLLDGNSFTISVPANCKITGYRLGYKAHNLVSKSVTYTNGKQSTGTITIAQSNEENTLTVTGLDNNEISFSVEDQSTQAGFIIKSLEITYVENEFEPAMFKAEIEGWRDNNPNTHLGTITIGGTAMKLTPAHQTASELTMPVVEGTAFAFTRQYRGFEFNGFYIGSTELGTNPTLTAENVAAIDENNSLIAKFTATDDVTLFYDDDEFSYRIPAIAKTGNGMLIAVSDYRHNLDDIGRDNHGTGTKRVDLVMRTSTDNGATWSETKTIAAGDNSMVGSYQRAYGDAAIAAVGQNIVVMAAAGDVVYTAGTTSSPNKMARIYSTDNGATWTIEEMTTKMYSQSTSLIPSGGSAFFGSGKLAVDPNFNGTGNARIYGALLVRIGTDGYNNFGVFSDDLGATWKILGGDNTNPVAKGDEPKVEILPNGQILLSARRGGGRVFRVFTYGDDKANGAGSWGDAAVNGCDNGGSNATNGEIICLDAKRPNGKPTKILLQSQPKGGSGQYDRRDVTIWYKEVSADETYTPATIASDWTMGKQVSTQLSAYSTMCLQANGEIALFFEEAPCYGDDYTKGYSMVYVPLTIEEITNDNFLNPNADVEYVPTEFSIVLTDAQDNEYRETLDYIPGDVAAVESYLTTTYPFITLGTTGAIADNTYTNTVTLPFKVSNANTTVWHNIYWPSNGTSEGEFYPIYMMANADDATIVAKITEKVHYGNSQYNTYNYADKLGWAVYNVNNSFTFKFKNKLTGKFMAVNGVVSSGNASNVIFTDETNATAFTLTKNTGTTYKGDFAITSVYNGTTGYVCNTSAGYADATNYTGNGHHGAWAKIVESPDYWTIYEKLLADINNFGAGDGKYTENDAISSINKEALRTMLFSELTAQATAVQNIKDSYTEITLTVPAVNDIVPGSVKILDELVSHKFVPKGNVTIQAIPAAGYRFVNWTRPAAAASAAARTAEARNSDVVSTDNPYTVNVSEALSLEANFEQNVVNATLTDAQGNTYEVQVSGFTAEITKDAVAEKLREAYPYITVGATDQEGNVIDFGELTIDGTAYTYTNMVELPFRVTNTTYLWHNIYYPSNSKSNPNYIAALNEDEIVDMAASAEYAYGDNPTYNTRAGNPKISWAIYNVNNNFEFIFKNAFTQKYIKVESVANATTQNVKFVENAEDATTFTLSKDADSYNGDYALVAKVGDATGYLCATSSAQNYVTHFDHANHQGAWVKFVEAPYYDTEITDLGLVFSSFFGAGDGKYIITDEMSVIDNAIANNSDNITFNTINEYYLTIEEAIKNWPAVRLTINPAEGGTTNINGEENVVHKYVPNGYALPLAAVPADGYRFVNWTLDGNVVSTDANYNVTVSQDANYVANFEIEESQDGLTTGYYHIVSRVTSSHEYLYNNALRTNNSKEFTLQSDSKITTNNGIWYITVNSTQLGVKNGDGNALVTGAAYCGNATTHNKLNIEKTTDVDGVIYYSFIEGINCTNRSQYNFTLEGGNSVQATDNNYVTTWTGHPDDQANQWRLEPVDMDGMNVYDVVVECTENDVYVTYGSEYAFDGGFFITDATITAQQLTAKKGNEAAQGVTVLVEGNTIRVVYAEYVNITVSATPAEGGSVTINGEAESTLQVVKSSNVTVDATPADGYHFVNWTDAGGNAVSTDNPYTFKASESTSLTANFEADVVYHTITVSTFYDNDGGTVKVGDENATSVNVADGGSVRMVATVNEGYEFMGWLKDGVIVKNAIGGGLDFEVQGPDYTLYEIEASAEYVAVFSKITDYTNLEDGKAYRIRAVSESCETRYIYREGTELKWKNDDSNFDDNSIFVVQKNGNSINLISAIGYHGWKASNILGNDEQYNPYAAIKVTYGTKDDTRSLYLESGTSSGIYTTRPDNVFAFVYTPSKSSLPITDADNSTTNFLFEEVDTYAFQVSVADGSNAKLGTINLPFATTVHPSITAYAVTGSDENYAYVAPLTLENNILPANTPVLVEAEAAGKYGFKPAPASNTVYETGFAGTLGAKEIADEVNAYILSYKGAGTAIKLYKLASNDRTINANKAYYIDETGSSSAISFKFIGTTDINGITDADSNVEGIYDLQGRKLDEITEPGIYIVNGKKILVK